MKRPFSLIIICLTGLVASVLGLSVRQTPEKINAKEGENVSINCYIELESRSSRIIVKWFKNNLTVNSEPFNTSIHQLSYSGNASVNASLHLNSVHPNHSGIYHCKVSKDIPTLEIAYGKGTHVYIVNSSKATTPSPHLTVSSSLNPSGHTEKIWALSGVGIFLLIICIAFVIHIYYKGDYRRDLREEIALNDVMHGSQHSVTPENVVYAAINVSTNRESIKSEYEDCAALLPTTVTCNEESVTYSEVYIKSKPNNEGTVESPTQSRNDTIRNQEWLNKHLVNNNNNKDTALPNSTAMFNS